MRGSGQADRWHVEVVPRGTSGLDLRAVADVRLNSRRWQASAIGGRVVIPTDRSSGRNPSGPGARRAANIDPATAAGAIEVDATLDGTLDTVRSTGRVTGRSVTLAGLPPSDLDVSFGVDVAGKTSTGTFRLLAPDLSSSPLASQSGLALGGSLTAAGSWSGPLSAPIVDASVTGRNLTVARGGSLALTETSGVLDATFKGPLANWGWGHLTFESVQVAGRDTGNLASTLTMAAGVVQCARARART